LGVGGSILTLTSDLGAAVELHREGDGTVRFNKPPRTARALTQPTFDVPEEPVKPTARHFSVIQVLAPLALGLAICVATGSLYFLLFSLLSPVMLGANAYSDRRSGRREYAKQHEAYDTTVTTLKGLVAGAVHQQELDLRATWPDPATIAATASGPTQRLWERRRADVDFLVARVGLGDRRADINFTGRTAAQWPEPIVRQVPITVSLKDAGVLGVAGPRALALSFTRGLCIQLATLQSPSDLRMVFVSSGETDGWDWIKWLPHVTDRSAPARARAIAVTDTQRKQRLEGLQREVEARVAKREQRFNDEQQARATTLLVLDDITALRTDPTVAYLLREGPSVGVLALCVARDHAGLPAEASVTIEVFTPEVGPATLTLRAPEGEISGVLPDGVSDDNATEVARALAPLFEVESAAAEAAATALPDPPLDEFEVLGLNRPTADDISERWTASASTTSLRARIGALAQGPFDIDLPLDGPHALIAGTTGSGKSEFLQTLVASLALETPPSALNFLLVDFKGRSAFRDCERLPHTLGVISNLDGRLVERALDSIQAELRWRQLRFDEVNAKDYTEYARFGGDGRPAIPRLAVIIDELKEVADAYSDAVTRLNQAARLGRSLGVHLILATQKPSSVAGLADLRGNTDLRMCLRVVEDGDSRDLVGVPDAANIAREHVGRGIIRTSDGRRVTFQTGYLGGAPPAAAAAGEPLTVQPFDLATAGEPKPRRVQPVVTADDGGRATELELLVDAIRDAEASAPSPAPRMPWLPPLPPLLVRDDARVARAADAVGPRFALGLTDVPSQQRQDPLIVDFDDLGHMLVIGPPRSGRTTTLRSLAGIIAAQAPPDDVHVYVLDFRRRGLVDLEQLPHCGAVIGADEPDRLERLLGFLEGEVERRSVAMQGASSLAEQRNRAAPGEALPYIVVMCDDYDAFAERFAFEDGGRLVDRFMALLGSGVGYGIHFVITGDRRVTPTRLGSGIEARLFLRPVDRDDQLSLGIKSALDPETPPGRGYWYRGPAETQVCLLDSAPGGESQVAAISQLASAANTRVGPSTRLPVAIRALPNNISLRELGPRRTSGARPGALAVGVGGIDGGVIDIDLVASGSLFSVVGPRGAGRSTALMTILAGLNAMDVPPYVVALAPRPSPLRSAGLSGAAGTTLTDAETMGPALADALEREGPVAVLIDDAELLVDSAASARLDRVIRAAPDNGWVVVMAGTTSDLSRRFSGWSYDVRQSRTGIILQPTSSADGELLDVRLPRSTGSGRQPPPGRGILAVRGEWMMVHVATP
jgi:S-DNA-T family DNA segregation ATPase FtsK/SpoIIIE